jgi:hypothetical protein
MDSVVMLHLLELMYSEFTAKLGAGQSDGGTALKVTVSVNWYSEQTPIVVFSVEPASVRWVDGQA